MRPTLRLGFAAACLLAASPPAAGQDGLIPRCDAPRFDAASLRDQARPLLRKAHEVLAENEARGGAIAYCLSDARMTNARNGMSFGMKQYDLAQNPRALGLLLDVLGVARSARGVALQDADLAQIRSGRLSRTAVALRASGEADLPALLARVNQALASAPGRDALDRIHREDLARDLDILRAWLDGLSDTVGARRWFAGSDLGVLLLFDYRNFFGTSNAAFRAYLNGEPGRLANPVPAIQGDISFTDLFRFILATKQGSGRARDERAEILRRLDTVLRVEEALGGPIQPTPKDRSWLAGDLRRMLEAAEYPAIRRNRERGLYRRLEALASR